MLPSLTRVGSQKDCDPRLVRASFCDSEDHRDQLLRLRDDFDVVQPQKGEGADQPGPLVPVDERMIANDVEEVRGGDLLRGSTETGTVTFDPGLQAPPWLPQSR